MLSKLTDAEIARYKKNIQATTDFIDMRNEYWRKWTAGDGDASWELAGPQLKIRRDKKPSAVADAELIAVITWKDDTQFIGDDTKLIGEWIWGHVLPSERDRPVAPPIDQKIAASLIPDTAKFFAKLTFQASFITLKMIEYLCVEIHKFDSTAHIHSGDKHQFMQIYGLRNTTAVKSKMSLETPDRKCEEPSKEGSYYVLEVSVQPGGARKSNYYYLRSLKELNEALRSELVGNHQPILAIWYGEVMLVHIYATPAGECGNAVKISTHDLHRCITYKVAGFPPIEFGGPGDGNNNIKGFSEKAINNVHKYLCSPNPQVEVALDLETIPELKNPTSRPEIKFGEVTLNHGFNSFE